MSSASINNSAAKVAVKVPFPDSVIEVRMSPPDSNFEVKVTPGGDVIELLIRPGCSQIEVRITQPGDQGEDKAPLFSEDKAADGSSGHDETPAGESAEEAEEEVVPGVSKSEFAAMVEEDAADEAKKLLAEMNLSDSYPSEAGTSTGYELPPEARKILENNEPPVERQEAAAETQEPEGDGNSPPLKPSENQEPVSEAQNVELQDAGAEVATEVEADFVETEAVSSRPAEADDSPTGFPPEESPELPAQMELEIDVLPGEIIDVSNMTGGTDTIAADLSEIIEIAVEDLSPRTAEEPGAERPAEEEPPEDGPVGFELENLPPLTMESGYGDEPTATIPEAVEEAARQALAGLYSAPHDGGAKLELEQAAPRPQVEEDASSRATHLPDQAVDRTIMVEYIEDNEAGPQHMPDDTATPLPEEDQMDLGPVEAEDEELAIGPIDLGNLELDLEKSRSGNSEDSQTTVKAKPMVTALPNNTIVPQ